jgi:hypothetical protein
MHGDNGNADRLGGFLGWGDGCMGEQTFRESNRWKDFC